MTLDRIAVHGLRLLAGVFGAVSLLCLLDPTLLLGNMEIGLETATALAEVRAGYGGTFAGLAVLFAVGAQRVNYRSLALGVASIVLGTFTLGRLLSLATDGVPSTLACANHAVEAVGFALALWLWRATANTER
jgi:hypothetical protein